MKISKKQIEKIKKLMPIERKPAVLECTIIYGGKWMQMEGITKKIRELAYNLYEI